MRAAIGAVEPHRDQALGRGHVDPVGVPGEVRPARASGRADHGGVAPFGGNPDEVEHRSRVHRVLDPRLPRCAQGHDPLAVGRPDRVAVERGGAREPLGLALAVAGPLPDVAALGRPAHVSQRSCRRATSSGETRAHRRPRAAAACRRADPSRTASSGPRTPAACRRATARGSWINRAFTGPSSTRTGKLSREPTGCDTRAVNGITWSAPVWTSSRWILPP